MPRLQDLIRSSVRDLRPYQPGKPIEEVQRELGLPRVIKLASNEYPEGPFPEVVEAVHQEVLRLHRYPDATWFELGRAVAEVLGVPENELLFGNGANEILELVVHLLCEPGDQAVFAHPSFPIYGLLCQSHYDVGVRVPLDPHYVHDLPKMAEAITESTRVVFVCNPNNPTGTYVGEKALREFLQRVPSDVVVALDEAYVEFATADDFPDFFRLRRDHPNLLSIRSFSKVYSLAGIRIGYAIGDPELIGYLQRVRQPFNVNRLAQVAASVAIRCQHRVRERHLVNARRLALLREGVERLGCTALPSQANFLLVFTRDKTLEIFPRLLREGVIVRPMHTFGLEPGSFRVNVGTDEENEAFLAALGRVLDGTCSS